jgi:hypothetical protein
MKKLMVIALISLLACNGSGDGEKDTPEDSVAGPGGVVVVDTTDAWPPDSVRTY